ncbi:MAG: NAAT family transporter [Gammaproteobacteria bacterium]|nr:NAAT family transporter [Gammaproteobacteria bacterium]
MTLYTAALTLILVMDPVGNIPLFITTLKGIDPFRQKLIILRETIIAFIILTIFLFFGSNILHGLNITGPALYMAGGIILFLITIRMIFPVEEKRRLEKHHGEPFIVPLAIPLTAGPSALATVLLFATQEPEKIGLWFLAVSIASAIFVIIMLLSPYLLRILGQRGLIAMERLMGMLLTTVAVQMFLQGLKLYFQSFAQ